jgi:hypothetical protein
MLNVDGAGSDSDGIIRQLNTALRYPAILKQIQDIGAQSGIHLPNVQEGITADVLPRLIVIGDESAGKSSTLERIAMAEVLPRSGGVCTRQPVVLQLRHDARYRADAPHLDLQIPGCPCAASKALTCTSVRKLLAERMQTIAAGGGTPMVIDEEITLTIRSEGVPTLDLVDLPGLVQVMTDDADTSGAAMARASEECTRAYLRKRSTGACLCVVDASVPQMRSSRAIRLLQEAFIERPNLQRYSIGVLAKADQARDHEWEEHVEAKSGPMWRVVERLLGTADDYVGGMPFLGLRGGFVAVINRNTQSRKLHQSLVEHNMHERRQLRLLCASKAKGLSAVVGLWALIARIDQVLSQQLHEAWVPARLAELAQSRAAVRARLDGLGTAPADIRLDDLRHAVERLLVPALPAAAERICHDSVAAALPAPRSPAAAFPQTLLAAAEYGPPHGQRKRFVAVSGDLQTHARAEATTLEQHNTGAANNKAVTFSADGAFFVASPLSAQGSSLIGVEEVLRVYDGLTGVEVWTCPCEAFSGVVAEHVVAELSNDGQTVVLAGKLRRSPTCHLRLVVQVYTREARKHPHYVNSGPSGQLLAAANVAVSADGAVFAMTVFEDVECWVNGVAQTDDGHAENSVRANYVLQVRTVRTGGVRQSFLLSELDNPFPMAPIALAADGATVLFATHSTRCASSPLTVYVGDVATGDVRYTLQAAQYCPRGFHNSAEPLSWIQLCASGSTLLTIEHFTPVSSCSASKVVLHRTVACASGGVVASFECEHVISSATLSLDGSTLAFAATQISSGCQNLLSHSRMPQRAYVYDVPTGVLRTVFHFDGFERITALRLRPTPLQAGTPRFEPLHGVAVPPLSSHDAGLAAVITGANAFRAHVMDVERIDGLVCDIARRLTAAIAALFAADTTGHMQLHRFVDLSSSFAHATTHIIRQNRSAFVAAVSSCARTYSQACRARPRHVDVAKTSFAESVTWCAVEWFVLPAFSKDQAISAGLAALGSVPCEKYAGERKRLLAERFALQQIETKYQSISPSVRS